MSDPIKILFLSSNPKNISRIRLDEELREVDERIRLGGSRDQFELIPHVAVRPRDLLQVLMRHTPHVLHFSGHGSSTEGIVLEDNNGQTKLVKGEALANLFAAIKDNLRVVVLNACYSALQTEGISKVVDCTIGMNKKIGDRSAIVFSAAFYEALAYGRNIKEAFDVGIASLMIEGIPEESTPTLLTREGVKPAEVYLTSRGKLSSAKEPSAAPRPEGQNVSIDIPGTLDSKGDISVTGISN